MHEVPSYEQTFLSQVVALSTSQGSQGSHGSHATFLWKSVLDART